MSFINKLNEIENAKNNIKISLENKGKQPGNDIREYAALINSLDGNIPSVSKVRVLIQELEPEDTTYQGFWIKSSTFTYNSVHIINNRYNRYASSINIVRQLNQYAVVNKYKTDILQSDIAEGLQYDFYEVILTNDSNDILYDIPIYYGNGTNWINITPKEYRQLEYIESTGTQIINTAYTPNNDTKIELQISNIANGSDIGLLSANTRWQESVFLLWLSRNVLTWSYGKNRNITSDIVSKHKIILYRASITLDDTVISSDTSINSSSINTTLHLFSAPDSSYARYSSFRLYSLNIYENDLLVRQFIPVYDNNNVACIYDKITENFYYNSGTGEFKTGLEI